MMTKNKKINCFALFLFQYFCTKAKFVLTKEAIILAGGLGTRLQKVVQDVPKVLAPVAQKPFLYYLLKYAKNQGLQRLIFSLGYKNEMISEYLNDWKNEFEIITVIEDEPLGTGGGIRKAVFDIESKNCFVLNADTFFDVNLNEMYQQHISLNADLTMALKPLRDFERYGIVEIDSQKNIIGFKEKQPTASGLINGGIYLLNKNILTDFLFPDKFSFEKDFLETHVNIHHFFGFIADAYFIDIGVPEDFEKANKEFIKIIF
jgi:D-glycero-alpha-D-manno-heptose 1-phosphate guanylyltransferase